MTEEAVYTRLLESLLTEGEPPSTHELSPLSDLDLAQINQFDPVWNGLNTSSRQILLATLGRLADERIELQFDRIYQMALRDPDAEVRRIAIENLWESQDQRFISFYLDTVENDPAVDVKIAAIRALGRFILLGQYNKIDSEKLSIIEDTLLKFVSQVEEIDLQRTSIEALGYSSRPGVEAIIQTAYLSSVEALRQSALLAMGRSANEIWAESILKELISPSPNLRAEAARATGELELRSGVAHLIDLLEDVNDDVRKNAIWSLGQIGGTASRDALEAIQTTNEDNLIREQIEEALEHIAFLEGTPDFLLLNVDEEDELA
jgi:HEAT repeat protein